MEVFSKSNLLNLETLRTTLIDVVNCNAILSSTHLSLPRLQRGVYHASSLTRYS